MIFLLSDNRSSPDPSKPFNTGGLVFYVYDPSAPDPQNLSISTEGLVFDINDCGAWSVSFSTAKFDEIIQKGSLQETNCSFPNDSEKNTFFC